MRHARPRLPSSHHVPRSSKGGDQQAKRGLAPQLAGRDHCRAAAGWTVAAGSCTSPCAHATSNLQACHVLRAGSTPAPVDPLACLLQEAQRRHFELVTWSTECL